VGGEVDAAAVGGREVRAVDDREHVAGQRTSRQGLPPQGRALHEVLELRGISRHPVLVRLRERPAGLGLDLLGDVLVPEHGAVRRVRLDGIVGVDVAEDDGLRRVDRQLVPDPAQHDVGGGDLRDRAVVEAHEHGAPVLHVRARHDVEIARRGGPERLGVRELGDLGEDRHGPDGSAAEPRALVGLQVEDAAEGMASLAEERPAAGRRPPLVRGGVRPRVALLSRQAQDGPGARRQEAARFLDRRRVDPVLRVAEAHAGRAAGLDQRVGGRQGAAEHLGARRRRLAEEPRERLLDDQVLLRPGGLEPEGGVDGVRDAQVHEVDLRVVQDPPHVVGRPRGAELGGEGAGALRPAGRHPAQLDVDAADVPVRLGVDSRDEPRAHHPHADPRPLRRHHASLDIEVKA
jgi:hypothetical protein